MYLYARVFIWKLGRLIAEFVITFALFSASILSKNNMRLMN